MTSHSELLNLLAARRPLHSLPQPFYNDPGVYQNDLAQIWYREWIFAAASAELPKVGSYVTVQLGVYSIIVVRGADKIMRAFHNSCRHRGSRICTAHRGTTPKLVCPYHQWTYELDGRLLWARDMGPDFSPGEHGLGEVHCREFQGMVYICLADQAPDTALLEAKAAEYMAAHDLANLKVAHQSRIVEQGNWKLVMENNRECYHCSSNHPELCITFPDDPAMILDQGDGVTNIGTEHIKRCEAAGLPSKYLIDPHEQWRFVRVPFVGNAVSYTMDGKPACAKRVGTVPFNDAGALLYFHYPNSWNHFLSDKVITFRMMPIGPQETEVTTTWLIHKDAVEGVDYDIDRLTKVWIATNDEDRRIVEENQRGVNTPGYRPGPYSPVHELGVNQFVDWYCNRMRDRLAEQATMAAE